MEGGFAVKRLKLSHETSRLLNNAKNTNSPTGFKKTKLSKAIDAHFEDLVRKKTDGKEVIIFTNEQGKILSVRNFVRCMKETNSSFQIDVLTSDALIEAKRSLSAVEKPKNFLNKRQKGKCRLQMNLARQLGVRAEFWFKYGADIKIKNWIKKEGGIVKIGLGDST